MRELITYLFLSKFSTRGEHDVEEEEKVSWYFSGES